MDNLLEFTSRPSSQQLYMIAGWRQWADAGSVSSALPEYLVEQLKAKRIGRVQSDPFYIFQVPGAQDFLRPEIKLDEGHRADLRHKKNEFYYYGDERQGLCIFLGDEPHLNIERYAEVFFNLAQELGVKRIVALGGVYAPVPYDKDRQVSCSYSLPRMKKELRDYAVRFSNYEGGVTIGAYLLERAEALGIEYLVWNAMVPMYDLSQISPNIEGITVEDDYKAWYDILRRINYMFKFGLDLSDLEEKSHELVRTVKEQVAALETQAPQAQLTEFFEKVNAEFNENSFMPLDDVWQTGLGDILKD